ncbi:MAG TPA: hypothetical protein VJL58_01355, partial [Pyrinomonadaceae bacterium]|nr:hypothetical protein [Pyrinomonadaceae bacterium]
GYILDPHGAVGFKALADYLSDTGDRGIFLETAHPVKFDSVESILGREIQKPDSVLQLENKAKASTEIAADYGEFKDFLLTRI